MDRFLRHLISGGVMFWGLTDTVAATGAEETPDAPRLRVVGNQVLSDYVYEAVVDLGDLEPLEPAERVQRRILRFLRQSGYELATVKARTEGDSIVLEVDEGKLERIIFPGQDALRAAGMQLALDLPKDIFNRKAMEAQLPRLEKQFGVTIDHFEIRDRAEKKGGLGPGRIVQLERFVERFIELPPEGRYELYVFASAEYLPAGFDFDADFQGPDGLTTQVMYRFKSAFLSDDRLELIPEIGLRVQDVFDDPMGRRFVSRGGFGLRWLSPEILGLRSFVSPSVVLISRQRQDLGLRSYDFFQGEPVFGVTWPIVDQLRLFLEAGVQYRRLLGLVEEEPTPRIEPLDETRLRLSFRVDAAFGLEQLRIDRRHRVQLEGRVYPSFQQSPLWVGKLRYDKSFGFGFDEFVVGMAVESVSGAVSFVDEIRVSDHLRGLYGERFYSEHIASLRLEYQWAVLADYFKLSAFHDGVVFQGRDRTSGEASAALGNAFGLGAHTIIFDMFKVSLYGVFGFISSASDGELGLSLSVEQLF